MSVQTNPTSTTAATNMTPTTESSSSPACCANKAATTDGFKSTPTTTTADTITANPTGVQDQAAEQADKSASDELFGEDAAAATKPAGAEGAEGQQKEGLTCKIRNVFTPSKKSSSETAEQGKGGKGEESAAGTQ